VESSLLQWRIGQASTETAMAATLRARARRSALRAARVAREARYVSASLTMSVIRSLASSPAYIRHLRLESWVRPYAWKPVVSVPAGTDPG
jgi:hypothetical protein